MNIKIKSVYVKYKNIYFTKDFKDLKHFLIVEYQNELNRYVEDKKSTKLQKFYKSYLIDTHKVNIILLGYRLTLIKTYIKCVQRIQAFYNGKDEIKVLEQQLNAKFNLYFNNIEVDVKHDLFDVVLHDSNFLFNIDIMFNSYAVDTINWQVKLEV